jgi:hypothetical protein
MFKLAGRIHTSSEQVISSGTRHNGGTFRLDCFPRKVGPANVYVQVRLLEVQAAERIAPLFTPGYRTQK